MEHITRSKELSEYELDVLDEIKAWRTKKKKKLGRLMSIASSPASKAADKVMDLPGVDWVVEKTAGGLISILGNLAHWSVNSKAVYREYRQKGFQVYEPDDIFHLDLEDVDIASKWLAAKYQSLAAAEGAALGVAGLPGLPADIMTLTTLNQRAVSEHAVYYGFDVSQAHEKLFAMDVLVLASSNDEEERSLAIQNIRKLAITATKKKVVGGLQNKLLPSVIKSLADRLGLNMVKSKGIQFIPVVGLAMGAGSNSLFTGKVCQAARNLYRERFLLEKYGPDILKDLDLEL